AEEVAFDPVAGEVVRDAEHEAAVVERDPAGLAEPRSVRRLAEGASEPTGDFMPQTLSGQLDLMLHPVLVSPCSSSASAHPTNLPIRCKCAFFAGNSGAEISLHSCGEAWVKILETPSLRRFPLWISRGTAGGYTAPPVSPVFSPFL